MSRSSSLDLPLNAELLAGQAVLDRAEDLVGEIVDARDAARIAEAVEALAARAADPNVFHGIAPLGAGLDHLGGAADVKLLTLWQDGAAGRRLVGFLPVRVHRFRWFVPLTIAFAYDNRYTLLSTPLLDRAAPARAMQGLLRLARRLPGRPVGIVLRQTSADGPCGTALSRSARHIFSRHERAVLRTDLDFASYLADAVNSKKRKEYGRQRRRLEEIGALAFDVHREPKAVAAAVEDFFALERAGWKGERGTALSERKSDAAYFRRAIADLAAEDRVRLAMMRLDGRAIAAGIVVVAGGCAFYWKTAYDESLAKFSPGVLFTLSLTEHLLDRESFDLVDSCAAGNHPMIDHLWRQRRAIQDVMVATLPEAGAAFRLAARLETARRALRERAKTIVHDLRRRLAS